MEEEESNENSTISPSFKRRRLDENGDDNGDTSEIVAENNEINSSLFDTAFTSQLPDESDLLATQENNIEDIQPNETAAEEGTPAAPEASEHDSDDDDNLPKEVKDILSWNRVSVNGEEITDKSKAFYNYIHSIL